MPEQRVRVETYMVKMICPKCGIGTLNRDDDGVVLATCPPLYRHVCSACGLSSLFNQVYPRIEYDEVEETA